MFGLGQLPKEYNPKVHGPYDPAIFYGPTCPSGDHWRWCHLGDLRPDDIHSYSSEDTPLGQVKVAELPAWLSRRGKSPQAMARAVSRAYWRWSHKYYLPKYSGLAPFMQVAIGWSAFFYILNYPKFAHHRNQKYHW